MDKILFVDPDGCVRVKNKQAAQQLANKLDITVVMLTEDGDPGIIMPDPTSVDITQVSKIENEIYEIQHMLAAKIKEIIK